MIGSGQQSIQIDWDRKNGGRTLLIIHLLLFAILGFSKNSLNNGHIVDGQQLSVASWVGIRFGQVYAKDRKGSRGPNTLNSRARKARNGKETCGGRILVRIIKSTANIY